MHAAATVALPKIDSILCLPAVLPWLAVLGWSAACLAGWLANWTTDSPPAVGWASDRHEMVGVAFAD